MIVDAARITGPLSLGSVDISTVVPLQTLDLFAVPGKRCGT